MPRPLGFDPDDALDRSVELFWTWGYDGTSIADLERELGVGRQSLYNAFGDKRALFHAALDRYAARSQEHLDRLSEGGGGLEAIRAYFSGLVDFLALEGRSRGCLLTRSLVDHGADDPGVALRCERQRDRIREGMEAALKVAVDRGEIEPVPDPRATARLLVAQTYGLSALASAGADRAEMAEVVDALLTRL